MYCVCIVHNVVPDPHCLTQTGQETQHPNSTQTAAHFVKVFLYGFNTEDTLTLIRLDDLYLETLGIKEGEE